MSSNLTRLRPPTCHSPVNPRFTSRNRRLCRAFDLARDKTAEVLAGELPPFAPHQRRLLSLFALTCSVNCGSGCRRVAPPPLAFANTSRHHVATSRGIRRRQTGRFGKLLNSAPAFGHTGVDRAKSSRTPVAEPT